MAGTEGRASAASSAPSRSATEEPPSLIVSGHATPEEVAALVAVLTTLDGQDVPAPPRRSSAWSDPSWRLVGPAATRGGWRRSGLPR